MATLALNKLAAGDLEFLGAVIETMPPLKLIKPPPPAPPPLPPAPPLLASPSPPSPPALPVDPRPPLPATDACAGLAPVAACCLLRRRCWRKDNSGRADERPGVQDAAALAIEAHAAAATGTTHT